MKIYQKQPFCLTFFKKQHFFRKSVHFSSDHASPSYFESRHGDPGGGDKTQGFVSPLCFFDFRLEFLCYDSNFFSSVLICFRKTWKNFTVCFYDFCKIFSRHEKSKLAKKIHRWEFLKILILQKNDFFWQVLIFHVSKNILRSRKNIL